jgi:hypothetical protein
VRSARRRKPSLRAKRSNPAARRQARKKIAESAATTMVFSWRASRALDCFVASLLAMTQGKRQRSFLGVITGLDPIAVRKNGVASLARSRSVRTASLRSPAGSRLGRHCVPKRDGRVKPGHDEGEDLRAKRSSIVKQPDTHPRRSPHERSDMRELTRGVPSRMSLSLIRATNPDARHRPVFRPAQGTPVIPVPFSPRGVRNDRAFHRARGARSC